MTNIGKRLADITWRLGGGMLLTVLIGALAIYGVSWPAAFAALLVVLFYGVELGIEWRAK